jgi:hypothetical protein
VATFLMAAVIGLSGLVGVVSSARAAHCCAQTNYACAGLRTADDCCRGMGHSMGAPPVGTIDTQQAVDQATAPAIDVLFFEISARLLPHALPLPTATRFHDPPHLHTFALLI